MGALKIQQFRGMAPRLSARLLPEGMAQLASNIDIASGEIRPVQPPLLVNTPGVSGPWVAVYRAVDGSGGAKWLAYAEDADVARGPLPSDVEARYYLTREGFEPRFGTYTNIPTTWWALGIPSPQTVPGVSPSGGSGAAVTRSYCYTFVSQHGEESGPSPFSTPVTGKVDDTWAITSMDAFPTNSGTGTASHSGGFTTFTNGSSAKHWLRVGDRVILDGDSLVVTEIPAAHQFKVAGDYSVETTWAREAGWNITGMTRRLYRTSGSAADMQLVAEGVGTTYNDTLLDSAIAGDSLITSGWAPPPVGLRGLIALSNGAMAGFVGNLLCYSEPYQPHAWPSSYQYAADFKVVGIAGYGQTVIVATEANPYIADGVDPASVTLDRRQDVWPCLSKRSVISVGDGAMYSTRDGYAYVGASGARLFTDSWYTERDWRKLNPASIVAALQGRYIMLAYTPTSDEVVPGMLRLPLTADEAAVHWNMTPTEIYVDPTNGYLYVVDSTGINQWDAQAGYALQWSWYSGEYNLPNPVNFTAAFVDVTGGMSQEDYDAEIARYAADVAANAAAMAAYKWRGGYNGKAYARGPAINDSGLDYPDPVNVKYVTFTLIADDQVKYSRVVVDKTPFRLPSGYKSDVYEVQLSGTATVHAVELGETMLDLKTV